VLLDATGQYAIQDDKTQQKAQKLEKKLYAEAPYEQQIVVYYNQAKCLKDSAGCLSNKHELGQILVWRGLSNLQVKLAFSEEQPSSNWDINIKNKHISCSPSSFDLFLDENFSVDKLITINARVKIFGFHRRFLKNCGPKQIKQINEYLKILGFNFQYN
jgi:hypothetical protein